MKDGNRSLTLAARTVAARTVKDGSRSLTLAAQSVAARTVTGRKVAARKVPDRSGGVSDDPGTLGDLLKRYGLRPRKELGQHFLSDPQLLNKIVQAADLPADVTALEVGPGPGMLTRQLATVAGRVVAVELDEMMVRLLHDELEHLSNVEIVHGDVLSMNPPALVGSPPVAYAVVANLPYYITSAVIRHMLEADPPPFRLVLTVQLEVAQRIVATPGDMSLLAVSVQFYGQPRIVMRIPAGAFVPPPQVDSAVLRIDTHSGPPVEVPGRKAFFRVVRAGFGQKRKQLRNSLSAGLDMPVSGATTALVESGIDPTRRAETLNLDEWATLTRALLGASEST
jgi:16S rRNA (adenine1518-N6/adenine1519-N6)-dimethyltransferase